MNPKNVRLSATATAFLETVPEPSVSGKVNRALELLQAILPDGIWDVRRKFSPAEWQTAAEVVSRKMMEAVSRKRPAEANHHRLILVTPSIDIIRTPAGRTIIYKDFLASLNGLTYQQTVVFNWIIDYWIWRGAAPWT